LLLGKYNLRLGLIYSIIVLVTTKPKTAALSRMQSFFCGTGLIAGLIFGMVFGCAAGPIGGDSVRFYRFFGLACGLAFFLAIKGLSGRFSNSRIGDLADKWSN
jgi:hypothetical protein